MQEILIESIRTDQGVQSRAAINSEYVAELAEQIKAGVKLPPVDVFRAGGETWMADGFHRLRAHEAAGKRSIRAEVHKGGQAEAAWFSVGANLAHGLRRTNADKQRAVEMALKAKPTLSDAAIAQHVGVSDRHVWGIRQKIQPPKVSEVETRTGTDGRTRRIPPPPPSTTSAPPPKPVEQQRKAPPTPIPPPAASRLDGVAEPIPDVLWPLWDRSGEVKAILADLSAIRGAIRRADGDPLYAEADLQAVGAALTTAYDQLAATVPYAVCPYCGGRAPMVRDCRACGGRGCVGRFRYDTAIPAEVKR